MRRSSCDMSRNALLLVSLVGTPWACGKACLQSDEACTDEFGMSLLQTNLGMTSVLKGDALAGAQNLCIASPKTGTLHLAPEWLLIGVQKGATSSFSQMFDKHPQAVHTTTFSDEPPFYAKELHIFDIPERFDKGKDFWLSHYPNCSRNTRLIAHDATPDYTLKANHVPVAANIKSYYQENSPLIKFGIILRDPLERIHSAFYQPSEAKCTRAYTGTSFQEYVVRMLNGDDPCELLSGSDYPNQLQSYFDEFGPSQFTIYRFHDIISPTGPALVVEQWRRLGLQDAELPVDSDPNWSFHSKLKDDLDENTLASLKALVASTVDANKVARVLLAQPEKPIFVSYTGNGGADSVAEWLLDSW